LTWGHKKKEVLFEKEEIAPFSNDLLCLLPTWELSQKTIVRARDLFGDRLYLLVGLFLDGKDAWTLELGEYYSKKYAVQCIATNAPLYHSPKRKPLQDVLTCIQNHVPLRLAGFQLLPNAERFVKSKEHLAALFQKHPEWLTRTVEVAKRCQFSLEEIHYHYPNEWLPKGETAEGFLAQIVWEGADKRYPKGVPSAVKRQLEHELVLIQELKYADYFLTTWDIVRFARSKNILCQGRGSAANSIVCYVLGITSIDPVRMGLLFERFLSRERDEPPDIDIDFEHERREEVIQYIYQRYGRMRAAITAEVICYRRRSALREVAKVFEIPEGTVHTFLTLTHKRDSSEVSEDDFVRAAPTVSKKTTRLYYWLYQEISGFPRHLGIYVGGFVLCHDPLSRNVPIEKAAMPNRTIIQWDKNDLDALGFVRIDVLGLGILTCIRKCFDILKKVYGTQLDLASILPEDPKVYESIC